jgi:hypothetical protein
MNRTRARATSGVRPPSRRRCRHATWTASFRRDGTFSGERHHEVAVEAVATPPGVSRRLRAPPPSSSREMTDWALEVGDVDDAAVDHDAGAAADVRELHGPSPRSGTWSRSSMAMRFRTTEATRWPTTRSTRRSPSRGRAPPAPNAGRADLRRPRQPPRRGHRQVARAAGRADRGINPRAKLDRARPDKADWFAES